MSKDVGFFPQHGEVASLIRSKEWSETALGPPSGWPPSLCTVLRLMLTSRFAMWMGWGPELSFFYNDEYAKQTLGAKHPWALGRPFREVWAEVWDALSPRIDHVLATGEATWDSGLLLFLERSGYREETYHTFSYSPAPGEAAGETSGLFCVVVEETERVIGDRRIALLRDLASLLGQTMNAEDVFAAAERCLKAEARDIPFSITYLFDEDGRGARRVSQTGFDAGHVAAPDHLDFGHGERSPWPLASLVSGGVPVVVDLSPEGQWPTGPWDAAPTTALVVPIAQQGHVRAAGVFIAGHNPHRPLDDGLRSFAGLVVGQIAAALANAGAYEEARKRAEALAEIDRAKTAFFSNVSHEFRTPLTLMLGPTEDALASPGRVLSGDALEMVHRNELRLMKLVNALLDFARIEAGRIQASYEPTDLSALTVDLASSFRSAIDRAGLAFEVVCEPLPEHVHVDRDMWEKIVLNLLSNALKFTLDGHIRVAMGWKDDHAVLTVQDSGVGISESELPRLFERFHRIEGVRARTHEGSGIGLALVHELVRLHGGKIDVTSTPGKGTTFTISVPKGTAHLPAERIGVQRSLAATSAGSAYLEEALRWTHGTSPREPEVAAPDSNKARVLVADDNADMREYIARILRQHWAVETVSDGAAALASVRRSHPDLVLSDVMMPHVDGFELVREIRSDPSTAAIPVILLSARAGEEATAEGLRAGANDYLVKPFSASAILVRAEAQLSAARLRAAIRKSADEERARLQSIFRDSPAAIAVLRGRDLRVEMANPLMLDMWGKSSAVMGKPLMVAVPELEGQGFDDLLRGVLDSGNAYRGREVRARVDRGRDGVLREMFVDFVYSPLMSPDDGQATGIFVHAYDVTDKVIARGHIDQLRRDAEAANRLKDEFLATMSHELRTPLNAILGWAALLQRGMHDKASVDRALVTIERNARAQARLIEDVLDVSRIVSGKLRLDMRRVDLNAIARAAMDVVKPAAEARRVIVLDDFSESEGTHLIGDPDRLQQVVWNLLSNAVKFTPADGSVSIHVARVGDVVRIVVRDTGLGIPPEHLPFIFERFRQVDSSTTRKHGGLGLGLAIVRHLVELHGGSVAAESAGPGRGATFTVTLPVRESVEAGTPEPAPVASTSRAGFAAAGVSLSGVRVLVVDDEEDSRLVIEAALGRAGASVVSVPSAATALAHLQAQPVDVLISDVGMPEEDGFSLLKRVRALPTSQAKVPAIALTAYARGDDVAKSLEVGFQRHVAKPADVDELAQIVALLSRDRAATG